MKNTLSSIIESNTCLTYEQAIKHITSNVIYTPLNVDRETGQKKKHDFALEVLNNDILIFDANNVLTKEQIADINSSKFNFLSIGRG